MTTTQGRIVAYRHGTHWHADMSDATGYAEVRDLFGTSQLPTPYPATMRPRDVERALAALNPQDTVEVRP